MATSTIPAFTAALKAALEARAGLAGVPVTDGFPPAGVFDSAEWIALLDVEMARAWAAINSVTKPQDERYSLELLFSVRQSSRADQTTGAERVLELFAELEQQLVATPSLEGFYTGPGQLFEARVASARLSKRGDNEVREAALEVSVEVYARL